MIKLAWKRSLLIFLYLSLFHLCLKSLKEKKLISKKDIKLKILGTGELKTKIDITAHYASKQAQEKIEKIGGKLNITKK